MAKHCEVCGKVGSVGSNVSHAHNVTKRRWEPNLQRIRVKESVLLLLQRGEAHLYIALPAED